jgi:hypothetical protein
MSAESDYHCTKCGHEWCAIPPSECSKCNPPRVEVNPAYSIAKTWLDAIMCVRWEYNLQIQQGFTPEQAVQRAMIAAEAPAKTHMEALNKAPLADLGGKGR